MTLFFADVSNWQQGMSLAGMPAVIAKATEGTGYRDPFYAGYQQQARAMGVPFVGYHYLHHGSIEAQAQLAFSVVGAGVPLMLDVEVVQGEADPTLADVTQFVAAYRTRGGRATLIYLPQWFWSGHWGSPDLRPLEKLGLALISSNYTTYSDTGPGWRPYGGVTPAIWQYTSTATINGRANVDMNAFRGTTVELAALFAGGTVAADDPTPEDEMATIVLNVEDNQYYALGADGRPRKLAMPKGVAINDVGFVLSGKYRPGGKGGPARPGVLCSNPVIDAAPHIDIPAIPLSVIALADEPVPGGPAVVDAKTLAAALADPAVGKVLADAAFAGAQRAEKE